jgi:hypothetical protein
LPGAQGQTNKPELHCCGRKKAEAVRKKQKFGKQKAEMGRGRNRSLRCLSLLLVRQESSVVLVKCNVFIMVNSRKPCSQLCGWWEQSCRSKPETANARAVVSRELVSASLNLIESGQPSRRGEARIGPEASTKCKGRTLRGERRQRVQTEPLGTWEARHRRPAVGRRQSLRGSHNLQRSGVAESDRPIVAEKFRLESEWSQGALAKVALSQRSLELIG